MRDGCAGERGRNGCRERGHDRSSRGRGWDPGAGLLCVPASHVPCSARRVGVAMPRHLALAAILSIAIVAPARAEFRVPQVAVTGSALQNALNAQGQTIDVATEQRLATGFAGLYLTQPSTHFIVRTFAPHTADLAVFDMTVPSPPPLYVISPAALLNGSYTEVSFDSSPTRMVVRLFDQNDVFQGSTSYLGLGFQILGLAISGPGGVFYPYDERNSDGRAHALVFRSTGFYQGGTWLCGEDRTQAGGGDFDFA